MMSSSMGGVTLRVYQVFHGGLIADGDHGLQLLPGCAEPGPTHQVGHQSQFVSVRHGHNSYGLNVELSLDRGLLPSNCANRGHSKLRPSGLLKKDSLRFRNATAESVAGTGRLMAERNNNYRVMLMLLLATMAVKQELAPGWPAFGKSAQDCCVGRGGMWKEDRGATGWGASGCCRRVIGPEGMVSDIYKMARFAWLGYFHRLREKHKDSDKGQLVRNKPGVLHVGPHRTQRYAEATTSWKGTNGSLHHRSFTDNAISRSARRVSRTPTCPARQRQQAIDHREHPARTSVSTDEDQGHKRPSGLTPRNRRTETSRKLA